MTPPAPESSVGFAALAEACAEVVGAAHVLRSAEDMAPFASDFWRQFHGRPALVVRPATTGEVADLVRLAGRHGVGIVPQSGNTGLVNGGIADDTGTQLVLSLGRMNRIRHIDPVSDTVVAEAGCVLAAVQAAAAAVDRLFPLSLGAKGSCQIGGNLATNAGGLNVLRYGMARDLVLGLEAVLADGSVYEGLTSLRKNNTGYDVKQLLIGSEGTLGIITAAVLRLSPAVRERVTLWLAVDDPAAAVMLFQRFRAEFGELLSSFELLESWGVEAAVTHFGVTRPVDAPHPWHVLCEVGWSFASGLRERVEDALEPMLAEGLCRDGTLAETEQQRLAMWRIREGQSEATRFYGDIVRSDVAVAIGDIPALIARARAQVPSDVRLLAFGHVGDGNLHLNFIVPPSEVHRLRPLLLDALYRDVRALSGSISAEHGVGRAKRDAILDHKAFLDVELMGRLKDAFDPAGLLNPGVLLPKRDATERLDEGRKLHVPTGFGQNSA